MFEKSVKELGIKLGISHLDEVYAFNSEHLSKIINQYDGAGMASNPMYLKSILVSCIKYELLNKERQLRNDKKTFLETFHRLHGAIEARLSAPEPQKEPEPRIRSRPPLKRTHDIIKTYRKPPMDFSNEH